MKNILFALFIFCFAHNTFSQEYEPLVIENAHWIIWGWGANIDDPHAFLISGDTIINDTTYKGVYRQTINLEWISDTAGYWAYFLDDQNWEFFGAIREDTTERKVYAILFEDYHWGFANCTLAEENLLYDFSREPGDTVTNCNKFTWENDAPPKVTDIFYQDKYGQNRKTIMSIGGGVFNTVLEGIGNINGLFSELIYAETSTDWDVAFLNYCIGTDMECSVFVTGLEETKPMKNFKVFPNPATDKILIEFEKKLSNPAIQIFNIFGNEIFRQQVIHNEVDVSLLVKGIYYLKIFDGNSPVGIEKIIVQ